MRTNTAVTSIMTNKEQGGTYDNPISSHPTVVTVRPNTVVTTLKTNQETVKTSDK